MWQRTGSLITLLALASLARAGESSRAYYPAVVASVFEGSPNLTATDMMVGTFVGKRSRTFIRFSDGAFRPPPGATLKRARLVFDTGVFFGRPAYVYAHRVIDSWSASATWARKPDYYVATPPRTGVSGPGRYRITVTSIVREWIKGQRNYGFALALRNNNAGMTILRPRLEVTFEKPETKAADPDVAFGNLWTWSTIRGGQRVPVYWSLRNNSRTSGSGKVKIGVYLSRDGSITGSGDDVFLGSKYVDVPKGLQVTGWQVLWVTIPDDLPANRNRHYIGVIADRPGQVRETNENNNTRVNQITLDTRPDLLVTSVASSKTQVTAGETLSCTVGLRNVGYTQVEGFSYRLVLSRNSAIGDGDDIVLQDRTLARLRRLEATSLSFDARIPGNVQPGAYYVGAIVDPANQVQEINESGNTRRGNRVTVMRSGPAGLKLGEWAQGQIPRDYAHVRHTFMPKAGEEYVFEAESDSLKGLFLYVVADGRYRWTRDGKALTYRAQSRNAITVYTFGWNRAPGTVRTRVRLALKPYGPNPIEDLNRYPTDFVIYLPGEIDLDHAYVNLIDWRMFNRGLENPASRRGHFRKAFIEALLRPTAVEMDSAGTIRGEVLKLLLDRIRGMDHEGAADFARWAEYMLDPDLRPFKLDTSIILGAAQRATGSKKAKKWLGRFASVASVFDEMRADAADEVWQEFLLQTGATALAEERMEILDMLILQMTERGSPIHLAYLDARAEADRVIESRGFDPKVLKRVIGRILSYKNILHLADGLVNNPKAELIFFILEQARRLDGDLQDLRRLSAVGTVERLLELAKRDVADKGTADAIEGMRLALGVDYYRTYSPLMRPQSDFWYDSFQKYLGLWSEKKSGEKADYFEERAELLMNHLRRRQR